jgi:hypothetical protein
VRSTALSTPASLPQHPAPAAVVFLPRRSAHMAKWSLPVGRATRDERAPLAGRDPADREPGAELLRPEAQVTGSTVRLSARLPVSEQLGEPLEAREVMRPPKQAKHTSRIAADTVRAMLSQKSLSARSATSIVATQCSSVQISVRSHPACTGLTDSLRALTPDCFLHPASCSPGGNFEWRKFS